jgi:hypothetical protein
MPISHLQEVDLWHACQLSTYRQYSGQSMHLLVTCCRSRVAFNAKHASHNVLVHVYVHSAAICIWQAHILQHDASLLGCNRFIGCRSTSCDLCSFNPKKQCLRQMDSKYLSGEVLKAACGAELQLCLISARAADSDNLNELGLFVQVRCHLLLVASVV